MRHRMPLILAAAPLVALLASPALGAQRRAGGTPPVPYGPPPLEREVVPQQTGPLAPLRVPQDYATVQEAVDAAPSGATVWLAPGTHLGGLEFRGRPVTVEGIRGPGRTELRGDGLQPTVRAWSDEGPGVVLRGVRVTQGRVIDGIPGGGISLSPGASILVEDVHVVGARNIGDTAGRGIGIGGGTPTLRRVYVADCGNHPWENDDDEPGLGGGIFGAPIMEDVLVEGCFSQQGGGLYLRRGSRALRLVVRDCVALVNGGPTIGGGGGIFIGGGPQTEPVLLEDSLIEYCHAASWPDLDNTCPWYIDTRGGGIRVYSNTAPILRGTTVRNCIAGGTDSHGNILCGFDPLISGAYECDGCEVGP